MHAVARFDRIRAVLRPLQLREGDFAAGNDLTVLLRRFKDEIGGLESVDDPWAVQWLGDEHQKAATLYVAAKLNWNHEQGGKGSDANRRMRASIIARFNMWVQQVLQRLDVYEAGDGTASSVERWLDELALFKDDPIHNL